MSALRQRENSPPPFLRILLGPTASSKEAVATICAQSLTPSGEIIVVDSMKVYCGLNIATASPTAAACATAPHHCVNIVEPTESFDTAQFVTAAEAAIHDIVARNHTPILSGGTALYYKGLLEGLFSGLPANPLLRQTLEARAAAEGGDVLHAELAQLDPRSAERIHPNDMKRVIRALEVVQTTGVALSTQQTQWRKQDSAETTFADAKNTQHYRYPCSLVGLHWERARLYERIETRVDRMLDAGLLDEARDVFARRETMSRSVLQAVGYKELFPYFSGDMTQAEAVDVLKKNTRHLAKSQMTWFRKFPCAWVTMNDSRTLEDVAAEVMQGWDNDQRNTASANA